VADDRGDGLPAHRAAEARALQAVGAAQAAADVPRVAVHERCVHRILHADDAPGRGDNQVTWVGTRERGGILRAEDTPTMHGVAGCAGLQAGVRGVAGWVIGFSMH